MKYLIRALLLPTVILILILPGCQNKDQRLRLDDDEKVTIDFKRYGEALFTMDLNEIGSELERLSGDFFFFIGEEYKDTLSIIQIAEFLHDPLNMEIADFYLQKYRDTDSLEDALNEAFSYYHHYFPDAVMPTVYTYLSGLNYENPVDLIDDSVMIIALDMYLGKDFDPYKRVGLSYYQVLRMDSPYILTDCFKEISARRHLDNSKLKTLLDHMIYQGKVLLFLDYMLPDVPDEVKIGYSSDQFQWAKANEPDLWAFLIENDLLYTTRYFEINKLMQDGPFTNGFGKESPARLGQWLGWYIVKSYADNHPEMHLEEILGSSDSGEILRESGYRPGRS